MKAQKNNSCNHYIEILPLEQLKNKFDKNFSLKSATDVYFLHNKIKKHHNTHTTKTKKKILDKIFKVGGM